MNMSRNKPTDASALSRAATNGEAAAASSPASVTGAAFDHNTLPPLARDPSFWGMATTQFLGAFNDNLFKQLILLLATPTAVELAAGKGSDSQGLAMVVFSVPFLLFSGIAGYLSDRISKRWVVVGAKCAEVLIMLLGFCGFWWYDSVHFSGMMVVLFLMGTHSAFFGPAKFGILPEMIRQADLPRANGIFLMLTFMAIIFGMAAAGYLLTYSGGRIWLGSLVCIGIAMIGVITSLAVRRVPAAQPSLEMRLSSWGVPAEIVALLRRDRQLLLAIVVVSMFWMVAGIVASTVNALGKTQLGLPDKQTSLLTTSISVGIAAGCVLGGYLSRDRVNSRVVTVGAIGLIVTLIAMALPGGPNHHLFGYYGSFPVLILMGMFTGMFVVPVQVIIQSRPPRAEKGRMIATMNQCTWVGIILGSLIYAACIFVLDKTGWPRSTIFAVTAVLMLPVALFYRPNDEPLPVTEPANE
jgi:acyl-[acyl-carrier-protein]-phospholipid O-acyltransferase/long-chain-fatty-acid--[acyl-carrier-protein] ligase